MGRRARPASRTASELRRAIWGSRDRGGRALRHALHPARGPGRGLDIVATRGAIARCDDGQIAECWNLPAELHAVPA
jgi:hypothetical protein